MKNLIFLLLCLCVLSAASTTYKNGEKYNCDSISKMYYESGVLQWETPYADGNANGVQKEYYESGELLCETPYRDGKKNGITKMYYASGVLLGYCWRKGHMLTEKKMAFKKTIMSLEN